MGYNKIEENTEIPDTKNAFVEESKPRVLEDSWTSGKQIEETPALAPPCVLKQVLEHFKKVFKSIRPSIS